MVLVDCHLAEREPAVPSSANQDRDPRARVAVARGEEWADALHIRRVQVAAAVVALRARLVANGLGAVDEEQALAIYLYTTEADASGLPLRLYRVVNGVMHSATRNVGDGGLSADMRVCMPYMLPGAAARE